MQNDGMKLFLGTLLAQLLVLAAWTGSWAAEPVRQVQPGLQVAPAPQAAPLQQVKPADLQKLPDVIYNLVPAKGGITRIPAKIPIKPSDFVESKADLVCTVNAFHDAARTRPVQNHVWHLSPYSYNPFLPTPWNIYWDVVITNQGTAPAGNFMSVVKFQLNAFSEPLALAAGESAVLQYYTGPFGPSSTLIGKQSTINVFVDTTTQIAESNEGNNLCANYVQFVNP